MGKEGNKARTKEGTNRIREKVQMKEKRNNKKG